MDDVDLPFLIIIRALPIYYNIFYQSINDVKSTTISNTIATTSIISPF